MKWYEIYYSTSNKTWDVYLVTGDGQNYTRYKVFRTEAAADRFAKSHWVKRWIKE